MLISANAAAFRYETRQVPLARLPAAVTARPTVRAARLLHAHAVLIRRQPVQTVEFGTKPIARGLPEPPARQAERPETHAVSIALHTVTALLRLAPTHGLHASHSVIVVCLVIEETAGDDIRILEVVRATRKLPERAAGVAPPFDAREIRRLARAAVAAGRKDPAAWHVRPRTGRPKPI